MRDAAGCSGRIARVGALNELQYRANLLIQLVESAITLATGLVVLALVFNQVAGPQRLVARRSCSR